MLIEYVLGQQVGQEVTEAGVESINSVKTTLTEKLVHQITVTHVGGKFKKVRKYRVIDSFDAFCVFDLLKVKQT